MNRSLGRSVSLSVQTVTGDDQGLGSLRHEVLEPHNLPWPRYHQASYDLERMEANGQSAFDAYCVDINLQPELEIEVWQNRVFRGET